MSEAPRISPERLQERREAGEDFLVVCAYDDREKCDEVAIDDSIPFPEFEKRVPRLDESQKIAFYCD